MQLVLSMKKGAQNFGQEPRKVDVHGMERKGISRGINDCYKNWV
jgi:hypothetical protein